MRQFFNGKNLKLICPSDQKAHRKQKYTPPIIKQMIKDKDITIEQLPSNCSFDMSNYNFNPLHSYDLGIVVSFGYKIPKHIYKSFPYGMINVHPSLLPQFPGATPINSALLHNHKQTGITIQEIDYKTIDHGLILNQESIKIQDHDTYISLYNKCISIAPALLHQSIINLTTLREKPIQLAINSTNRKIKTFKIKLKTLVMLIYNKIASEDIYHKWRSLIGYLPVYTYLTLNNQKKRVNLLEIHQPKQFKHLSKQIWYDKHHNLLYIKVNKDQKYIGVSKLHIANKKSSITAKEFAHGYLK